MLTVQGILCDSPQRGGQVYQMFLSGKEKYKQRKK